MSWHIQLLGRLKATSRTREVSHFPSRKTALLLAYLARHLQGPHSREALADLLWPESEPGDARHSLRQALAWLRGLLEPGDTPRGAVILADRLTVQLTPGSVETDVGLFETALTTAAGTADPVARELALTRAVQSYEGDFVPEEREPWVLRERTWLEERYFRALGHCIAARLAAGDRESAIALAERGVRVDPLREDLHQEMMRLHAAGGEYEAAMRRYRTLVEILRTEIYSEPETSTEALAREIEQHLMRGVSTPQPALAGPPCGPATLTATMAPRLVTLLQVGVRAVLAGPDDPAAGRATARLSAAVVDAALRYEGRIYPSGDDTVLTLFGAPRSFEDDAERAVSAALEILAAAPAARQRWTAVIATGTMSLPRDDAARGAGGARELVRLLWEQSCAGEILIDDETWRRTRGAFTFAARTLPRSGEPAPRRVYRVTGGVPRPRKSRGLPGLRARLVGRDAEIAVLRKALESACAGERQVVLLAGEAGVGKTRLVGELKEVATPLLWLEGRCVGWRRGTGYGVWVDLLQDYLAGRTDTSASTPVARLVRALRGLSERGALPPERAEEIGPLLGHLLSLRFGTEWDRRLNQTPPEQIGREVGPAVAEFLLALAREQPVALVLDDLHWADAPSVELVATLMQAMASQESDGVPGVQRSLSLLLLCVSRPESARTAHRLGALAARLCPACLTEISLQIAHRLKGASSRALRREFPELRRRLPCLWSRSYYVGTVGHVSKETVERYIASQKGR